jgi:hypothetical protein
MSLWPGQDDGDLAEEMTDYIRITTSKETVPLFSNKRRKLFHSNTAL